LPTGMPDLSRFTAGLPAELGQQFQQVLDSIAKVLGERAAPPTPTAAGQAPTDFDIDEAMQDFSWEGGPPEAQGLSEQARQELVKQFAQHASKRRRTNSRAPSPTERGSGEAGEGGQGS
jgi:hypothetical protein